MRLCSAALCLSGRHSKQVCYAVPFCLCFVAMPVAACLSKLIQENPDGRAGDWLKDIEKFLDYNEVTNKSHLVATAVMHRVSRPPSFVVGRSAWTHRS